MKPLHIQEQTAEKLYREAFARHPKASRTAVLWWKWVEIKAKLIAEQSRLGSREKAA